MRLEARPLALLFALLGGMGGCCNSAQAGPPLICHPLEVEEGAELLPWTSTQGFRGTATGLTAEEVVARTLELLDGELPLFARIETMRLASLSLESELRPAQTLLDALVARTRKRPGDLLVWFDAGVLAATFDQGGWYFQRSGGKPSLRGTEPWAWLASALELSDGDPRILLVQALSEVGRGDGRAQLLFARVRAAVAEGRGGETLASNARLLASGSMRPFLVAPHDPDRDM